MSNNITGLPDNLPVFSNKDIDSIILQNRIYAWLVNNSVNSSYWNISRYGWSFELIHAGGEYIGKFWWNDTLWIASPYDGETEAFPTLVEAVTYVESFLIHKVHDKLSSLLNHL